MDGMTGIELIQAIVQIRDYLIRELISIDDFTHSKDEVTAEWTLSNPMICYKELREAYT